MQSEKRESQRPVKGKRKQAVPEPEEAQRRGTASSPIFNGICMLTNSLVKYVSCVPVGGGDDDDFADLVVEEDEGAESDQNGEETLEVSQSAADLQEDQPAKKPRKKARSS